MSISRAQVADLRPGDVVEIRWKNREAVLRGPIYLDQDGDARCGPIIVRHSSGGPTIMNGHADLTVISRAPRPLYVNHGRAEPVAGDVVRDADDSLSATTWVRVENEDRPAWIEPTFGADWGELSPLPRLRLLVNGETGQVVP